MVSPTQFHHTSISTGLDSNKATIPNFNIVTRAINEKSTAVTCRLATNESRPFHKNMRSTGVEINRTAIPGHCRVHKI
jgi:hypothetical protein